MTADVSMLIEHSRGEHHLFAEPTCTACAPPPLDYRDYLPREDLAVPTPPVSGIGAEAISDDEYMAHTAFVESRITEALQDGDSTAAQHALDADRGVWKPERARVHREIVLDLWRTAESVPCEGRAIVAAGPFGVDKRAVLTQARVAVSRYLTFNLDAITEELVRRGLAPKVPGLSPLETAPLLHTEAVHVLNQLAKLAYSDHRNVVWDLPMKAEGPTLRRIQEMRSAGYDALSAILVDVPAKVSVQRAVDRHRRGLDSYRRWTGLGERHVPPALIRRGTTTPNTSLDRATVETLLPLFDQWMLFDASGVVPELVSTSRGQR